MGFSVSSVMIVNRLASLERLTSIWGPVYTLSYSFAFLTQTFSLQQEHYFQYKDKSRSIFGGTSFVTALPFCSQVFLTKYSGYCLFCIFTKTKTGQCCINI